jgi:Fe2+ transport system protein FeoA
MKKIGPYMLILLGVLLLIWGASCNKPAGQRLTEAAQQVLVDDTPLRLAYGNATMGYPVKIQMGTLEGETLAATTIYQDHAVITVDVTKVALRRDRLEPVIGHEMYHVVDAVLRYGIPEFCAKVARDKDLPWQAREVELSAIQQENDLRQRLLELPKYKGMAATRESQNSRQ